VHRTPNAEARGLRQVGRREPAQEAIKDQTTTPQAIRLHPVVLGALLSALVTGVFTLAAAFIHR
jgi:hypothetical protein